MLVFFPNLTKSKLFSPPSARSMAKQLDEQLAAPMLWPALWRCRPFRRRSRGASSVEGLRGLSVRKTPRCCRLQPHAVPTPRIWAILNRRFVQLGIDLRCLTVCSLTQFVWDFEASRKFRRVSANLKTNSTDQSSSNKSYKCT